MNPRIVPFTQADTSEHCTDQLPTRLAPARKDCMLLQSRQPNNVLLQCSKAATSAHVVTTGLFEIIKGLCPLTTEKAAKRANLREDNQLNKTQMRTSLAAKT